MAASFTIADRNNGFTKADTLAATLASMAAYGEAMADFAAMGTLDIWYAHLDKDEPLQGTRGTASTNQRPSWTASFRQNSNSALTSDRSRVLDQLTTASPGIASAGGAACAPAAA